MIYRFDSAVNKSLDTMQDTIKFNKKSEQNENQDKKKFQNFLIERLLKSASEELSLVHLTHHSSASSVSNPPSDDYYSNHSVQPMKLFVRRPGISSHLKKSRSTFQVEHMIATDD